VHNCILVVDVIVLIDEIKRAVCGEKLLCLRVLTSVG